MAEKPLLSIIIPVYNNILYLKHCFNSIHKQTDEDFELIIVDDGSTDGSGEICEKYFLGRQNTKVIHQENGGSVVSRKTGIKNSSGKYIAFCDADDWVETNFVKEIKEIIKTEVGFVQYGIINERHNSVDISRAKLDPGIYSINDRTSILCDYYLNGIIMPMICKVVRRELCDVFLEQPDTQQFGEDNIFTIGLLCKADSFFISDKILYHYRIYDGSLSHRKGIEISNDFINQGKIEREMLYREGLLDSNVSRAQLIYFYRNLSYMTPYLTQITIPHFSNLYYKKVVLYGAGKVGKQMFDLIKNDRRIDIVGWVDSNFQKMLDQYPIVKSPDEVLSMDYDLILVCVKKSEVASEIISDMRRVGVSEDKILWEKPEMVVDINMREIGLL